MKNFNNPRVKPKGKGFKIIRKDRDKVSGILKEINIKL